MKMRLWAAACGLLLTSCAFASAAADPQQDPRAFCMEIASAGKATPDELAAVLKLLDSDDSAVVGAAGYALQRLGDNSPHVIRVLEGKLVGKTGEATRSVVGFTLMHLGEPGREVLERKARTGVMLRDRISAINALRANLEGLKDPELRELMQQTFPQIMEVYNPDPEAPSQSAALQDPQILSADFATDWTFFETGGATGSATFDAGRSRGDGGSIRLEKTDAKGEIGLRSVRPLKVRAGQQPMVRFYFHSEDADFNSVLQVYFERPSGSLSVGDINPRGWVVMGNTFLTNQAEGKWMKRFARAPKSKKEEEYYIRIVMRGNPATVWIDDAAFPAPAYRYIQAVPTQTLTEARYKEEPAEAAVVQMRKDGDRARLHINGEAQPPILYTSLRSSFGDYAGMEQLADVRLLVSSVQISDVVDDRYPPVTPVWARGTEFDFTTPLQWLEEASLKAQESNFVLNLHFCWPRDWVEAHPDEAWRDGDGKRGYGTAVHFRGFSEDLPAGNDPSLVGQSQVSQYRWWPSPFSEQALADAEEGVRQFVRELKTKPYANRVVGAHISGGHDFQFMTAFWPDYSAPAQKAFKEWVKKEYGTVEALRKAWHDPQITFETVEIPASGELMELVKSEGNIFIDPVKGQRYVDHQRFQAEQGLVIRERLGRAFKEAWETPAFAMTWQMGGGRGQGVETVLLPSEGLDMLVPQPFYELRQPGNVGGVRAALGSMSHAGKIAVKELDLRTWLRTSGSEVQTHRLGAAMNPEDFREIFRREAAQMIAAGHGFWFLDLGTTHFRDPEMLEAISDGARAYRELEINNPTPSRPDVAMVWVDDSSYWMADFFSAISRELGGTSVSLLNTIERYTPPHMKQAGVTYDDVYLSDLLARPDNDYKVLVFGDAFRLTDEQRRQIAEKLANSGRTLVWNYAAGYVGDEGLSDKAVGDLTGIEVVSEEVRSLPRVHYGDSSDPLVTGLSGMPGMGETGFNLMGGGVPKNKITKGFRRFVVTDETAVPLAFYEDGKTAAAVRRFDDHTSVYFGMMGTFDPQVLRRVAKEAGAYVISQSSPVAVEFNGRFLSLHGIKNGPVTLDLPSESKVYDFDTNELVATGKTVTLDLVAGQTRWFRVEPVEAEAVAVSVR